MQFDSPQTTLPSHETREEWQGELLQSYSKSSELFQAGLISAEEAITLTKIQADFRIRITPYYASLIQNDSQCPIRKQAIPSLGEEDPTLPQWATDWSLKIYGRPNPWHADAIGDLRNLTSPRISHRYQNRAILHLSSACAVYCRFCFRKSHLNDREKTLYEGSLEPAFQYLRETSEIREVILTGGDPLSLSDKAVLRTLESLNSIPHIRTVRFHTRMAVTLPSRFTESLLDILGRSWNFQVVLASHFNHPRELTVKARKTLRQLKRRGVTLLNQSVLMKGVNDNPSCLTELFQRLYEEGVIPFYLHHPDWTPGTFQFRLSIEKGREIFSHLKGALPGPAIPDYVLDIPQGFGKTSLVGDRVRKIQDLPRSSTIAGAVYELVAPQTRIQSDQNHYYLDLFSV